MLFYVFFKLLLMLFHAAAATPQYDAEEIGSACGGSIGDCPSLTCIPASSDCTDFSTCAGTCQDISPPTTTTTTEQQQQQWDQRVYTLCGGWSLMDDCDERYERCVSDPRNPGCGPACDGPGICAPLADVCGGETGQSCGGDAGDGREDRICFEHMESMLCIEDETAETGYLCGGVCLPLRFGSSSYEKSKQWEVVRTDQDGFQTDEDDVTPVDDSSNLSPCFSTP